MLDWPQLMVTLASRGFSIGVLVFGGLIWKEGRRRGMAYVWLKVCSQAAIGDVLGSGCSPRFWLKEYVH